jgi:hypothetical protein
MAKHMRVSGECPVKHAVKMISLRRNLKEMSPGLNFGRFALLSKNSRIFSLPKW